MKFERKSIANYTTSIAVDKTVAEISKLLAAAKATAILSELENGQPVAVSFRIKNEFGVVLTFRLPARVEGVYAVLQRSRSIGHNFKDREQAARVAWRIVLYWLDAQLAMIQSGVAKVEEIFLPYAQDSSGVTVYERLREQRFSNMLPPSSGGA
jgi:hypothetical protein